MTRVGVEEEDSIVDGNPVLRWALRPLVAEDRVWPPTLLGLAHPGQETLVMVSELCLDVLPELQREVHDHLVVAKPVDNQRGSRSRNQRVKVTHSGCCPWDGHHWNWSCAFEDVAGHRDKATGRGADWRPMLGRSSLSC